MVVEKDSGYFCRTQAVGQHTRAVEGAEVHADYQVGFGNGFATAVATCFPIEDNVGMWQPKQVVGAAVGQHGREFGAAYMRKNGIHGRQRPNSVAIGIGVGCHDNAMSIADHLSQFFNAPAIDKSNRIVAFNLHVHQTITLSFPYGIRMQRYDFSRIFYDINVKN